MLDPTHPLNGLGTAFGSARDPLPVERRALNY